MQLPEYGCQFSCERKSAAQKEVRRVVGLSSVSSWQVELCYTYKLGTSIKLSMLFQVLGLWLFIHLK